MQNSLESGALPNYGMILEFASTIIPAFGVSLYNKLNLITLILNNLLLEVF
ncbi:hypothetical protein H6G94_17695 [Nostoc punctiforme FACHB-252]|uniref:Uncharacterized protein n=1 Tax=Nostoc punctiforme FACHB-252 TaxID=1357509 RepID=A0ABR8HBJ6_NOSPU|nr:hypothetical protein [Nostoc punctiforme FACHB-252]